MPLTERLEARRVINTETGCWEWQGNLNRKGYGTISYRNRLVTVHRAAAHAYLGVPLRSPLHVLHRCDNRRCFNPEHLFLGTNLDNVRDRDRKHRRTPIRGRPAPGLIPLVGEANAASRLTTEDVRLIFSMLQAGDTQQSIADRFGVSRHCISHISRGDRWRHLSMWLDAEAVRKSHEPECLSVLSALEGRGWLTTRQVADMFPHMTFPTVDSRLRRCARWGLVERASGGVGGSNVWRRAATEAIAARGGEGC